ncbi:MAG TPA: ABC transporter permease [Bryobacteraceae bacterium]|nr:ABC transporter permease [Bryobacteraceae bacterium]
MFSSLKYRLGALLRRGRMEAELDEELRFHVERATEGHIRSGLPAEEARRRALLDFGLDQVKEECRDARGVRLIEEMAQDFAFGARLLRKNPGFTAAAALSLALGIGGNSAIFAVVDAFLFRASPLANAERLVTIATKSATVSDRAISYPNFVDWKRRNRAFEEMAAYRVTALILTDGAGAERVPAMQVSDGFFELAGMKAALGREFRPEEERPGAPPVAVISNELWQGRYAGDPGILGRTLNLSDAGMTTVIGVAPPGFRIGPRADVYIPLDRTGVFESRASADSLYGMARLKPGVTIGQARAQMDAIAAALAKQYPDANQGWRMNVTPFGRLRDDQTRAALLMVMGAVAFVLLIACVNVSNLLLARTAGRAHEAAIRKSLGATNGRLARQLLTESVLLSGLGGGAGLVIAYWALQGVLWLAGDLSSAPGGEPLGGVRIDLRVFLFTVALTLFAGLASGMTPAFRVSRRSLSARLGQGGAIGAGRREDRRWRDALVTLEMALALALLAGGGVMLRSLHRLMTADLGFDAGRLLTLSVSDATRRGSDESGQRLVEAIETTPGVEAAAGAFPLPFGHGWSGNSFYVEGSQAPQNGRLPEARVRYAGPHYARALGLRIEEGRWFTAAEAGQSAVINERMARAFWAGGSAVGRRFSLGGAKPPWITVVGVAANTRENGIDADLGPEIYMPTLFQYDIVVRTAGSPGAIAGAVRSRIRSLDKAQAVYDVQPMTDRISESLVPERFFGVIVGSLAAVALVMAAVGLYGVIAYSAARRTQEVGIRIALGAAPAGVAALMVKQGMKPVLAGIALGAAGALAATRLLASFLFDVRPNDPPTFAAVCLLLAGVALIACWLPARRATRISAVAALRWE